MPVNDDLGKRMKEYYEHVYRFGLTRRMPVAIRIDGKAFHTFTRGFQKPFDPVLMAAMQRTMKYLCENIQGCKIGYTQSDEITLILTDYDTLTTEAWFGYNLQKMCSIAASMATMAFNKFFAEEVNNFRTEKIKLVDADDVLPSSYEMSRIYGDAILKGAMFDARVFNIPKEEVINLLYWRQLDAIRNSIQMVGQAYFSHAELQNKSCKDIQDMLAFGRGIDWSYYPTACKRGTCCIKTVNGWHIDKEIPVFKDEYRAYIDDLIYTEGDKE
jgi:tRNA(His) 5'-end guanylyltransferase